MVVPMRWIQPCWKPATSTRLLMICKHISLQLDGAHDKQVVLVFKIRLLHCSQEVACGRCPGVYKGGRHSCGAPLMWVQYTNEAGGRNETVGFWRCSTFPECDFSETPHRRLPGPQLVFEAVSDRFFQVRHATCPTPGCQVSCKPPLCADHLLGEHTTLTGWSSWWWYMDVRLAAVLAYRMLFLMSSQERVHQWGNV